MVTQNKFRNKNPCFKKKANPLTLIEPVKSTCETLVNPKQQTMDAFSLRMAAAARAAARADGVTDASSLECFDAASAAKK